MQVGIINQENFPQILRAISQRRRHGILELHVGERILEISFYQGKIIDVMRDKQTLYKQIADRLVARDSLLEGAWLTADITADQLLEQSQILGFDLDSGTLKKMWLQRALENLYAIDVHSGSYYNFRVEFVATPASDAVSISVGQLLLDLVGYHEAHGAFVERCPEDLVLCRGLPAEREYSFEEHDLIWLVDGQLTIAELRERSMLNRLTFEETITSLLQEQILAPSEGTEKAATKPSLFDIDASLDACIDQALRTTPAVDLPQALVRQIWSEKQANAAIAPQAARQFSFDVIGALERANARVLSFPHTPDVVYLIFLVTALIVPWFFW
jgi:hypothetical protein